MNKKLKVVILKAGLGILTLQARYYHWRARRALSLVIDMADGMLNGNPELRRSYEELWLRYATQRDCYIGETTSALARRAKMQYDILKLETEEKQS